MADFLLKGWRKELLAQEPAVLTYLSDKYGKDFEIVNAMSECWGMPGDRFMAKPRDGGGIFTVYACSGPDGRSYCDNFSDEVQPSKKSYLQSLAAVQWRNFKMQVSCIGNILQISIYVPDTDLDAVWERLRRVGEPLAQAKHMAWIKVYGVDEAHWPAIDETADMPQNCLPKKPITAGFIGSDYRFQLSAGFTLDQQRNSQAANKRLTDGQLERLCNLVYLDGLLLHQYEGTLGDIVEYILHFGGADCRIGDKWPCEMTEKEWYAVLNDVRTDVDLSQLRVLYSEDVTAPRPEPNAVLPGHRAFCFTDGTGNGYVIFRGTCGDDEWYDNALSIIQAETVQQKAAARFVCKVKEELGIAQITVAGHSKGGNKAQYAALITPEDYVSRCLSLDGPGFSPAFLEKNKTLIEERKGRIQAVAERRDFVNALGLCAAEIRFFTGRRGNASTGHPYGNSLPYFHCPDALRSSDGQMGDIAEKASIPALISRLTAYFLQNPQYESIREETAVDLIALMMKNKRASAEETAEAISHLALIGMDLACHDDTFQELVTLIALEETDVLLATYETIAQTPSAKESEPDPLWRLVAEKIAHHVISDKETRKNFLCALRHLAELIVRILAESKVGRIAAHLLLAHIGSFVENILRKLANTLTQPAVLMVYSCWRRLSSRTLMRHMRDTANMANTAIENNEDDYADFLASLDAWTD